MTLAHSVSCKCAEQSPQERKSCQASILLGKGVGVRRRQTRHCSGRICCGLSGPVRIGPQVKSWQFPSDRQEWGTQYSGEAGNSSHLPHSGKVRSWVGLLKQTWEPKLHSFTFHSTSPHSQPHCLQSQKSPFLMTLEQGPDNSLDDLSRLDDSCVAFPARQSYGQCVTEGKA